MAYYDALIAKWATLSGTTQQKLDAINALTVTGSAEPMIIPTYSIYNLIDPTEWGSVSANNQQIVRDIIGMGTVDASPGTPVRTRLASIFPLATFPTTRAALNALAAKYDSPPIPWWQGTIAQGGGALNGPVVLSDLQRAGGLS